MALFTCPFFKHMYSYAHDGFFNTQHVPMKRMFCFLHPFYINITKRQKEINSLTKNLNKYRRKTVDLTQNTEQNINFLKN